MCRLERLCVPILARRARNTADGRPLRSVSDGVRGSRRGVTGGGDGATASVGVAPGPVRSARSARSAAQVRQAVALVKAAIDASPPQELSGPEARQMAELLGSLGELVAASVVRYSRCSGRDHVGLLAAVQGTSVAKAKAGISLLDRVSKVPEVRDAFSDGRLSIDQGNATEGDFFWIA